jgi:bifunctional non-homologous end joining protein LigD
VHFHSRDHDLCVWAFDLLHHNGRDLRELPLFERMARLKKLIVTTRANWLRFSAADHMKLEGIMSKRRNAPYRSAQEMRLGQD